MLEVVNLRAPLMPKDSVQNPIAMAMQQPEVSVDIKAMSKSFIERSKEDHSTQPPSRFTEFFRDREIEKKALYMKVVFFSEMFMLLSLVPLGIGSSLLSVTAVPVNILGQTLVILGAFGFSLALCAASTVPVEEFDIEEQLNMRPRLRLAVSLTLGAVAAAAGALVSCLPPLGPSLPLALSGVWIGAHELCLDNWPLLLKLSTGVLLLMVSIVHLSLSQVLLPQECATNASGLFVAFCEDVLQNPDTLKAWVPLMGILSAIMLLGVCALFALILSVCAARQQQARVVQAQEKGRGRHSGWATTILFSTLYLVLALAACITFFNGLGRAMTGALSFTRLFGYMGSTCSFLAPLVFLLFFSRQRAFSLLARYFEFDLARQQKDGAHMAYLVSMSSSVFEREAQRVWWVQRTQEDLALRPLAPDANHIQRNFWLKGQIVRYAPGEAVRSGSFSGGGSSGGGASGGGSSSASQQPLELTVVVDMRRDKDRSWWERYAAGAALEQGQHPAAAAWAKGSVDESESFCSWVYRNFNYRELPPLKPLEQDNDSWMDKFKGPVVGEEAGPRVVGLDQAARTVTLLVTIPRSKTSEKAMMRWAKDSDNFRSFDWENRKQDLFSRSPRELASRDEKDFLYSLSHPRSIVSNADKLDYFVSHSWEDRGVVNSYAWEHGGAVHEVKETKYDIVKRFMEGQRAALRRYPLLWLDKVCINQSNTGQAISVLPIIIGGCNQVLILLSPSYLKRLWCVWELFTLFTFCNKQLALERVVVLPISDFSTGAGGGEREAQASDFSFSLDEAHCFDPNEELKLREVMAEIGMERLNDVIGQLTETFAQAVNAMRREKEREKERVAKEKAGEAAEAERKKQSRAKADELEEMLGKWREAEEKRSAHRRR